MSSIIVGSEKEQTRFARYYAAHRQEADEQMRRWRLAHPEKVREMGRKANQRWRAAHPERAREVYRKYRLAHLEQYREWQHQWVLAHPEQHREWSRRWTAANPERHRIASARRRARLAGVLSTLTHAQWVSLCWNHQMACAYCKAFGPLTIDHVVPISKGGGHTAENIVPACRSCNSRKGDRVL